MKKISITLITLIVCLTLALSACTTKKPSGGGGDEPVIKPEYALTLDASEIDAEMTRSYTIKASVTLGGSPVDGKVQWSSSDENVATVLGGVVTAHNEGTAVITAEANGLNATCTVKVTASYAPKLTIGVGDAARVAVLLGGEYTLTPYVVYDGKRFEDGEFTYSVADTSVVTVSESGALSGVSVGETDLTVKGAWRGFGADSLAAVYRVKVARDFSVSILPPQISTVASSAIVPEGYTVPNSVTLAAKVTSGGVEVENPTLAWSIPEESEREIASVEGGVVTGRKEGKVSVSVSYTDDEGAIYTAIPVTVTVEFPCVDRTDTINLGEIDASDAYDSSEAGLVIDKAKVFGADGYAVTEAYEIRPEGKVKFATATDTATGNGVVRESGSIRMTAREQVWEIRNEHYGYLVSAFVITRVINNAADLMASFEVVTTASDRPVTYGAGEYYVLGGNIDATGTTRKEDSWTSSFASSGGSGFEGEFDGRGYTIHGLTLQNGGLFGNLNTGSVVKNFALTGVTLTSSANRNDYQPAPLAYSIYGDALIENVFIQITASTAPDVKNDACGIRGVANMGRGNNKGTRPVLRNSVIYMEVGDVISAKTASALITEYQASNYLEFDNVHVVSDYKLFPVSKGGDKPALGVSGVTRYGAGATNATFAAAYPDAQTALSSAGLDADTWSYDPALGYPTYKTYRNEYYAAALRKEFEALPASVNIDAGCSYSVPSSLGSVTLSVAGSPADITVEGGTVSVSASAATANYTLTVTSDVETSINKTVTLKVRSAADAEKAAVRAVFDKLDGKTYEFNVGKAGSWTIANADISGVSAADFGEVTLALAGSALSGVTVGESEVTVAANAESGSVQITVASKKYSDVTATITVSVLFEVKTVSREVLLSQNSDDVSVLDYSEVAGVETAVGTSLTYKHSTETEYSAAPSDSATFAAGKVTVGASFLASLEKVGSYTFRVISDGVMIEFTGAEVCTDIITTPEGLLKAFLNGNTGAITYGEGLYYALGSDIEATGYTQVRGDWHDGGFKGTFDGKGFSINGLTVQSGGLFGHLASGAVVKNFALTNTVIGGNSWQPTVIATNIYTKTTVENVFIHIAKVESAAKATACVRAFANLVRGDNNSAADMPKVHNVVIADASETKVDSLVQKIESGNDGDFANVHVITDSKLLGSSDTNEYLSGVTRYGAGAANATFAAAFASAEDVLSAAKLDKNYWTYDATVGYPVFTSYYENFLGVKNDAVTVSTKVELSKDPADNLRVIDYSGEEGLASELGVSAFYRVKGASEYTAIAASDATFEAGKLTLSESFLGSLTVAGENKYEFRVRTETKTLGFTSVTLYTNIIKTWEEFNAAIGGAKEAPGYVYGKDTYYVLGNNINATGKTKSGTNGWIGTQTVSVGFEGTFDGRGYTINGASVSRGGIFGYIGTTAVIKNVAITNLKFTSAAEEKEALFYDIYGAAVIENVFVHVADISQVPAAQNIYFVASALRPLSTTANAFDIVASIKNVVVVMDVQRAGESSATTVSFSNGRSATGNKIIAENVHVVSGYSLHKGSDSVSGTSASTPANIAGGITRYGEGAANASFAARYTNAATALTDAGLTSSVWTYSEGMAYPVFGSSVDYLG